MPKEFTGAVASLAKTCIRKPSHGGHNDHETKDYNFYLEFSFSRDGFVGFQLEL